MSISDDIRGEVWDLNLIPDLTGKVALVTGAASSGSIGFHIAHQLALKGAKVYVGARSSARAAEGIEGMLSLTPALSKDLLKAFVAELSDFHEVKSACDRFLTEESRLDLLIHNAAVGSTVPGRNGLTMVSAVNHVAPFIITKRLLPLLKVAATQSSDVRVVTLSSHAHKFFPGPVQFENKESLSFRFSGPADDHAAAFLPYAHSKLMNVLFARQLQRIADREGTDIISMSVHPGTVKTVGAMDFITRNNMGHILKPELTPLEGAITAIFAATATEVRKEKGQYGGAYLMPFGVVVEDDMSDDAKKDVLAEELWRTSESVVDEIFAN